MPGKTKWSLQNGIGSAFRGRLAGPDQVHAAGDRLVGLVVGDGQRQQALAGRMGDAGRQPGHHGDPNDHGNSDRDGKQWFFGHEQF